MNCRVSVDISALRLYRQNSLDCCRPSCVREPRLWAYLQRVDWLSLGSKTRCYQLLRGLAGPSYSKGPPEQLLSTCRHFDLPNTLISSSSHLYWFQALFSEHSVRRFNHGVSLAGGFALLSCLCENCYNPTSGHLLFSVFLFGVEKLVFFCAHFGGVVVNCFA